VIPDGFSHYFIQRYCPIRSAIDHFTVRVRDIHFILSRVPNCLTSWPVTSFRYMTSVVRTRSRTSISLHTTSRQSVATTVFISEKCEALTAVLLRIHAFWNITPCQMINTDVSKDRSAFIFRAKGPTTCRMLDIKVDGPKILWNVSDRLQADNA
jgi:hypothetical protein